MVTKPYPKGKPCYFGRGGGVVPTRMSGICTVWTVAYKDRTEFDSDGILSN